MYALFLMHYTHLSICSKNVNPKYNKNLHFHINKQCSVFFLKVQTQVDTKDCFGSEQVQLRKSLNSWSPAFTSKLNARITNMHHHIQSISCSSRYWTQDSPIKAYYQLSYIPSLKINYYLRKCSLRFEVRNFISYANAH